MEHSFWNATGTPSDYIEMSRGQIFQQLVEKTTHEVHIYATRVPGMLAKHGLTSVATMNLPWEGMVLLKFP